MLHQSHLIPEEGRQWLVNSRINLRTFNDVYYASQIRESGLGYT